MNKEEKAESTDSNKIKYLILIFIGILVLGVPAVYGKAHAHAHVSHSTSHASSHSTSSSKSSGAKTTIKGAKSYTGKTYTAPKSFSSKYSSSTIKTETVNSNPSHFTSYSTTNMFRPNFWTAMWAFKCMDNNTKEASEQDISKELEERGYSQEEIQEILKEGKEAEKAEEQQQKEDDKVFGIILICLITGGIIVVLIIKYIDEH